MSEWSERWPHFTAEEVLSKDQLFLFRTKGVFPYSFRALDKLQAFRVWLGKSLNVNHLGMSKRGARSLREVYEVNRDTRGRERGWEYSFHLWCAFDISSPELSPDDLFQAVLDFGEWGGVGRYDTFVHVDDRDSLDGEPVIWDQRS